MDREFLIVISGVIALILVSYTLTSNDNQYAAISNQTFYTPTVTAIVIERAPSGIGCIATFISSTRNTLLLTPCNMTFLANTPVRIFTPIGNTTINLQMTGKMDSDGSCVYSGSKISISKIGRLNWTFIKPRQPTTISWTAMNYSNCTFVADSIQPRQISDTSGASNRATFSVGHSTTRYFDLEPNSTLDKVMDFRASCHVYGSGGGGTTSVTCGVSKDKSLPAPNLTVVAHCGCKYGQSGCSGSCSLGYTVDYLSSPQPTGDLRYGFRADLPRGQDTTNYCSTGNLYNVVTGCVPSCYPEITNYNNQDKNTILNSPYWYRTNNNIIDVKFYAMNPNIQGGETVSWNGSDWVTETETCAVQNNNNFKVQFLINESVFPTTTTTIATTTTTTTTTTVTTTTTTTTTEPCPTLPPNIYCPYVVYTAAPIPCSQIVDANGCVQWDCTICGGTTTTTPQPSCDYDGVCECIENGIYCPTDCPATQPAPIPPIILVLSSIVGLFTIYKVLIEKND